MESHRVESFIAAGSLLLASVGAVTVAQSLEVISPAGLSAAVLPAAYVPRRTRPDNLNDEPFRIGLDDPSSPEPTNRAERRSAKYGHIARAFSTKLA